MDTQEKAKRTDGKTRGGQNARVVNLRTWKTRKRINRMRGRTSWTRYVIRQVSYLLSVLAIAAAATSCVPTGIQAQAVIWTWLFGVVGAIFALLLYVLYEQPRANRFLLTYLICMCVSLVAALVLVH